MEPTPTGSAVPGAGPGAARPDRPVPQLSELSVRRERLLRRLLEDPAPVTVVCAPAGFGKSSLLTRFATEAAAAGDIVIWLSLEQRDSDPTVLWTQIVEAIRSTGQLPEGTRRNSLAAPPRYVSAEFVDLVMEGFEVAPGRAWLVLDDLHAVRSTESLASIELLARRLPTGTHLVIASRSDPPIGLPRLRVQGRLRELRAADLAFTAEETDALLHLRHLDLPERSVQTIFERTEGWAAGIAIAAMALAGTEDAPEFLERFDGDDHAVADYLGAEALSAMSEELRAFLRRTCVCSRLTVGLAQRLSEREDAASVLDELVREGLFTQRLGRGRDGYRYHELLRTYLAADLRRLASSEDRRRLHRIAGEWWVSQGEYLHAIDHFRRAGDVEQLLAVASRRVLGVILDGRAQAVGRTFARFGEDLCSVPQLAVLGAIAANQLADRETADRWLAEIDLDRVMSGPRSPLRTLTASAYLARARLGDRRDLDLADLVVLLDDLDAEGSGDRDLELYALYNRGVARGYLSRYDEAVEDLGRATALARTSRRTSALVDCLSFLAGARTLRTELVAMRGEAEEAIELARLNGWTRAMGVTNAHVDLAWFAFLRADQSEAAAHLDAARSAREQHIDADIAIGLSAVELFVAAADGEGVFEALRGFRAALELGNDAPVAPAIVAFTAPLLVRICLDLGEHGLARQLAAELQVQLPEPGEHALVRGMLLHDAGRHEAARKELEPVLQGHAPCHVVTTDLRVRLLAAELEGDRGNDVRMHDLVCEALRLAEPLEVVQPFLELQRVRQHIDAGAGRFGRLEAFAARVRAAVSRQSRAPSNGPRLTPGEIAVLRELPSLMSLSEIAASRSLSVNTVKSHLRSIYSKLGVSGRREAVEAARHRDLL
jgi:LuxR family transcriptional regulator, maltose regulon positive regulatory protein